MKPSEISLSARITAMTLLFVAIGAALWIVKQNEEQKTAFQNERRADLEAALQVKDTRLTQSIEMLRHNVIFLANTPPILKIANERAIRQKKSQPSLTNEIRLQGIFVAFLRTHPDYARIRLIGVADGGRELVRVEAHENRIEITPLQALQAKGDRDYLKRAWA